jgi:hypothetical protein
MPVPNAVPQGRHQDPEPQRQRDRSPLMGQLQVGVVGRAVFRQGGACGHALPPQQLPTADAMTRQRLFHHHAGRHLPEANALPPAGGHRVVGRVLLQFGQSFGKPAAHGVGHLPCGRTADSPMTAACTERVAAPSLDGRASAQASSTTGSNHHAGAPILPGNSRHAPGCACQPQRLAATTRHPPRCQKRQAGTQRQQHGSRDALVAFGIDRRVPGQGPRLAANPALASTSSVATATDAQTKCCKARRAAGPGQAQAITGTTSSRPYCASCDCRAPEALVSTVP